MDNRYGLEFVSVVQALLYMVATAVFIHARRCLLCRRIYTPLTENISLFVISSETDKRVDGYENGTRLKPATHLTEIMLNDDRRDCFIFSFISRVCGPLYTASENTWATIRNDHLHFSKLLPNHIPRSVIVHRVMFNNHWYLELNLHLFSSSWRIFVVWLLGNIKLFTAPFGERKVYQARHINRIAERTTVVNLNFQFLYYCVSDYATVTTAVLRLDSHESSSGP